MSTAVVAKYYTPEDLLTMPDGDRYELVNGKLVERNMGWNASQIGGELYYSLRSFCQVNPEGWVVPADAGYQCFPDAPTKVRYPDVSFIKLDRIPPKEEREGYCRIAPDMAAEVISPNDLAYEVDLKVAEYLRAGVRLVWVINPETRTVRVFRADGSMTGLRENDYLDGEAVIPGFRCRVGDLFVNPAQVKKSS